MTRNDTNIEDLNIIFMGSSPFALPSLEALVQQRFNLAAVYTQPPRKKGRGLFTHKTPVHEFAEHMGIPVRCPSSLKDPQVLEEFIQFKPKLVVVVSYGLIIPKMYLDVPEHGFINVHPSLLPRWRGASPIQSALLAGDQVTGVSIMKMNEFLDSGPISLTYTTPVDPTICAGELEDTLKHQAATLLVKALKRLAKHTLVFTPQSIEGVCYAPKILNHQRVVSFHLKATTLIRTYRALTPSPGCSFNVQYKGQSIRVKILSAKPVSNKTSLKPGTVLSDDGVIACAEEAVQLVSVLKEGKPHPISGKDFLNGLHLSKGEVLTTHEHLQANN